VGGGMICLTVAASKSSIPAGCQTHRRARPPSVEGRTALKVFDHNALLHPPSGGRSVLKGCSRKKCQEPFVRSTRRAGSRKMVPDTYFSAVAKVFGHSVLNHPPGGRVGREAPACGSASGEGLRTQGSFFPADQAPALSGPNGPTLPEGSSYRTSPVCGGSSECLMSQLAAWIFSVQQRKILVHWRDRLTADAHSGVDHHSSRRGNPIKARAVSTLAALASTYLASLGASLRARQSPTGCVPQPGM